MCITLNGNFVIYVAPTHIYIRIRTILLVCTCSMCNFTEYYYIVYKHWSHSQTKTFDGYM